MSEAPPGDAALAGRPPGEPSRGAGYVLWGLVAAGLILLVLALRGRAERAPEVDRFPPPIASVKDWLSVANPPAWGAGGQIDFQALRGQVVVLDFWSEWCPPCRVANEALNRLVEREGLVLIGVTRRDPYTEEPKIRAYAEARLRFPTALLEASDSIEAYAFASIPHAVVIGRGGRIRFRGDPNGDAFRAALEAALAER